MYRDIITSMNVNIIFHKYETKIIVRMKMSERDLEMAEWRWVEMEGN